MLSTDNPFETLGLDRLGADVAGVKKAFRLKAFEGHPDRGGSIDAAGLERLKTARDLAISILQDGPDRKTAGVFDDSLFQAPFSAGVKVTRDVPEAHRRWRSTAEVLKGGDLEVRTRIMEAVMLVGGVAEVVRPCDCPSCTPGLDHAVCRNCAGRGEFTVARAFGIVEARCPTCRGVGTVSPIEASCHLSHGTGLVRFDVPAGTRSGMSVRIPGYGMKGPQGVGDLVVHIDDDAPMPERRAFKLPMSQRELLNGASTTVTLPGIGDVRIDVPAHCQPDTSIHRVIHGRHIVFKVRLGTLEELR